MKKLLLLCTAALALTAGAANAGIDLSWNNCNTNGGVRDVSFVCDGFSGPYTVVANFQPTAAMPNFVAIQTVTDLQSENGPVSDFWAFEDVGCNFGGLVISDNRAAIIGCTSANLWGAAGGAGTEFIALYQRAGNRARIIAGVARSAASPVPLVNAGTNNYAYHMQIFEDNAGICAGCGDHVAVVLNELQLFSTTAPGTSETSPGLAASCATANGATPGTCAATPTTKRTWGAVKSLYR